MLQAFDLSITVDPRQGPLFHQLNLSVGDGEKVALIGTNGVGKTRLIRVLSGIDIPNEGHVVLTDGSVVAYLPQDFDHGFEGTLAELYDELPYHSLARMCHRVKLDQGLLHVPYSQLSLGEKMRGAIAGLLAQEPTILLLDEPTNHLDGDAKAWLTRFLVECPESVFLICHDRAILNEVPTKIYELSPQGIEVYSGSYDSLTQEKRETEARQRREWDTHQSETKRLKNAAEAIRQRAARTGKKPPGGDFSAMAKPYFEAKKARVEKQAKAVVERVKREIKDGPSKPFEVNTIKLTFPTKPLRSEQALIARGLRKAFVKKALFENLNLTVQRHDRLAIVGPNGAGKTTLLRILLGEETADEGNVQWSSDVQIATLSQSRNAMDLNAPAFAAVGGDTELARTFLACLGMRKLVGERPVHLLSVGERTKVEIASMIMQGANVLVLDEPTNHLDIPSIEALEAALTDFPGAVIFVSHDAEFVDRMATETVELGK